MKRMVSPVIVNINSELGQLPPEIEKARQLVEGPYPFVILADPALQKIYGSYNHGQLKGQDYRKIFRDATKEASADIRNKTFDTSLEAKAAPKNEAAAPPADPPRVIQIESPGFKTWISSQGSKLDAKLVRVENQTTFVFVTKDERTLRVQSDQLSETSLKTARELAGLD